MPKSRHGRVGSLILLGLIGTFVPVRAWLHYAPNTDVYLAGYNIHHLFTGLLILVAAMLPLLIRRPAGRLADLLAVATGAGLALTLDEWVYLIATDGSNESYLLPVSLWGGVILIAICALYVIGLMFIARRRERSRSDNA